MMAGPYHPVPVFLQPDHTNSHQRRLLEIKSFTTIELLIMTRGFSALFRERAAIVQDLHRHPCLLVDALHGHPEHIVIETAAQNGMSLDDDVPTFLER